MLHKFFALFPQTNQPNTPFTLALSIDDLENQLEDPIKSVLLSNVLWKQRTFLLFPRSKSQLLICLYGNVLLFPKQPVKKLKDSTRISGQIHSVDYKGVVLKPNIEYSIEVEKDKPAIVMILDSDYRIQNDSTRHVFQLPLMKRDLQNPIKQMFIHQFFKPEDQLILSKPDEQHVLFPVCGSFTVESTRIHPKEKRSVQISSLDPSSQAKYTLEKNTSHKISFSKELRRAQLLRFSTIKPE